MQKWAALFALVHKKENTSEHWIQHEAKFINVSFMNEETDFKRVRK